jgi:hypothetical protein
MDRDTTRDNYEKPRGIVVCDLHVKRDQIMREADMKHNKLLRRMNVLTVLNISVCILNLLLIIMMLSKHTAPIAFGG